MLSSVQRDLIYPLGLQKSPGFKANILSDDLRVRARPVQGGFLSLPSPSSVQRPASLHAVADAALQRRVRTMHASSRQTYGAAA